MLAFSIRAYVISLTMRNVGSQSDIGYKSSSGELNEAPEAMISETESPVSEQATKTEYSECTNEPSIFSENEDDSLFEGRYCRRWFPNSYCSAFRL